MAGLADQQHGDCTMQDPNYAVREALKVDQERSAMLVLARQQLAAFAVTARRISVWKVRGAGDILDNANDAKISLDDLSDRLEADYEAIQRDIAASHQYDLADQRRDERDIAA
ncbi:hypothetical protein JUN65_08340 [Gluconacetobacter azotocaptans]|uniref:hypothetical protein n=1 Tax=Gluconacetobacter azotocaptans TaxID=142834 RepID=UPI00195D7820|nr:hypothetical protein [Gluconacetobacter azotocaptans]MBM9401594.1 hypothetical protein [Gluconacetobacter azotocaptans]